MTILLLRDYCIQIKRKLFCRSKYKVPATKLPGSTRGEVGGNGSKNWGGGDLPSQDPLCWGDLVEQRQKWTTNGVNTWWHSQSRDEYEGR